MSGEAGEPERGPRPARGTLARILRMLAVCVLVAAAAGAVGYVWLQQQFDSAGDLREPIRIVVEPGAHVRTVLGTLGARGAIRHPRAVELFLRITGRRAPRMQIGTYEIPAAASPAQILEMFDQGRVVLEQVTIIEGSRFVDLRKALDEHPEVTHALQGKSDAELMTAIGHAGELPEGRFFPDTYRFAPKTTDAEILAVAYNAMQHVLNDAWQRRAADLPLQSQYDALTLASIVEKETGLPAERARVAGVFVARLRKGMRLQTDPAVIYGLGASYDGTIRTRDLLTDTPYNTYTRAGLPPTPISLPGRASIEATLNPDETGDLYFVATGTGDGAHRFAKTLDEHNANVKSYLDHRRASKAAVTR